MCLANIGSSQKIDSFDPFSVSILVVSLIGLFLVTFMDFAGFYLTGYYSGYRYSCLTCEYSTVVDSFAILVAIFLLLGQIVICLNDLLPNKFLPEAFSRFGLIFAVGTLFVTIIGGAAFAIAYSGFEWWFETGFYGALLAGLINSVLFFLKGAK